MHHAAAVHDIAKLVGFALPHEIEGRICSKEQFGRHNSGVAVGTGQKALGHDAFKDARQLDADLILHLRRTGINDTVYRLSRAGRMQR